MSQPDAARKTFAVTYHYVADILEKRGPHRPAHQERLRQAEAEGLLLAGGAFADPVDGALLVMRAGSADELRAWADEDPYAKAGLMTGVTVREVNLAFGAAKLGLG